jgi:hypothetical protein
MDAIGKSLSDNVLAAMTRQAAPRVVNAIKAAAARTGVNFAYLMKQAAAESSFNAKAGSKTSSAKGLYQFIESTWLSMVKNYGDKHGLGKYAAMIDSRGKVSDPVVRKEILNLRNNPEKASLLAAEYASENQRYLERNGGLQPEEIGATELYLAHFLGAGSAAGFLKAYKDNPLGSAADLFPKAARANRNVFYDRETGQERTLAGVYDFFARKFDVKGTASADEMRVASTIKHTGGRIVIPDVQTPSMQQMLAETLQDAGREWDFVVPRSDKGSTRTASPLFAPGWSGIPVNSPAEIMLLAAVEEPSDSTEDKQKSYSFNN